MFIFQEIDFTKSNKTICISCSGVAMFLLWAPCEIINAYIIVFRHSKVVDFPILLWRFSKLVLWLQQLVLNLPYSEILKGIFDKYSRECWTLRFKRPAYFFRHWFIGGGGGGLIQRIIYPYTPLIPCLRTQTWNEVM